ncbi:centrin, putative [Plasmodium malariae]|uniref:Centrin, putative n=1 Tax=Plasmodium malariae TaxID=5858 RepID=A0A1A8VNL3_PLAMA|nr:centrin, putative [Plasmodium malariae]
MRSPLWKLKSSKGTDVGNQAPPDISEGEKEDIIKEFAEYDLNRDGLIDAEEILRVLKNMKKSDFVNFFTEVDSNSSGTISLKEYMIFISSN